MSNPVVFLLIAGWALKKMDDYRRSFISEDEYRRLQKEADEREGKTQPLLTDSKKV